MTETAVEKARRIRRELAARPERVLVCPKGEPEHRITLLGLDPETKAWCEHGLMREEEKKDGHKS